MELGKVKNNYIHPTAIVEKSVVLGVGNYIGPYCYITGKTIIGDNNRFEAYCSIGTPPEHTGYFEKTDCETVIGNNNIFREFTTVHSGSTRATTIGDRVKVLRGTYIGHDCIIHDDVNFTANVLIAGYVIVMSGVNFGLGSMCHQYSVVGAYSMIGMGTVITKTSVISPGGVYIGSPARRLKKNDIGLDKYKITNNLLSELNKKFEELKIENKLHSKYN